MEAKLANLDGLAKLDEHARRHFSGAQRAQAGGAREAAADDDGAWRAAAGAGAPRLGGGAYAAGGTGAALGGGLYSAGTDADIMDDSLPPQFRLRGGRPFN